MAYLFLALTIFSEVAGAISSRYSDGFKRLIPSVVTIVTIMLGYYFFAISLQYGMSTGVGYAIWAGVGVMLVAVIGWILFKESLTKIQVIGVALIIGGVAALEVGGAH